MRAIHISDMVAQAVIVWKNDLLSKNTERRLRALRDIIAARENASEIPLCQLGAQILGVTPERFFKMLEPELYPKRKKPNGNKD